MFEAGQLSQAYADNKTFVDALPTAPPAEIVAAYERPRTQPGCELKAFVGQYFQPPVAATDVYRSNVQAAFGPLDTRWTVLRRPGASGRFITEIRTSRCCISAG